MVVNIISSKLCPRCQTIKSFDNFSKDKSKKYGLSTYCKSCKSERQDKESRKLQNSNYYNKTKEKTRGTAIIKFRSIKTNCPRRGINFNLKKDEFIEWYNNQEKSCAYCGRELSQYKKGDDGLTIDRLNNSIGYEIGNIILCCWRCNIVKGYWFSSQEMMEIASKYFRKESN